MKDNDSELILRYHREHQIPVANERLHAAMHLVVENQLAMGEAVVIHTVARLQREGLSRHDTVHAVGSVLIDRLVVALREKATDKARLAEQYLAELAALTADRWKTEG